MKIIIVMILSSLFFLSPLRAQQDEYVIQKIEFFSHETKLSGSIVFPKNFDFIASLVFVHGSGEQSRNIYLARQFARHGIASLVYDKRGVGESHGDFESRQSVSEKNINLLADDSAAALEVLLNHELTKNKPVGLSGISQAGWIVPLAAQKVKKLDFIVLWSAPVCKVSEEDIFSKYTADLDSKVVPSYTEAVTARIEKYIWPDFLGKDSNPVDSLKNLNVPGLWIFGENDGSVPTDLSIAGLKKLQLNGHQYDYVLFSSLGHNNMKETFITGVDWIKRKFK